MKKGIIFFLLLLLVTPGTVFAKNMDIYNSVIADITSPEFLIKVSMGEINGATYVHKFGENPDIDTATVPEDLWDVGGTLNVSTTANVTKISSSSSADTQRIRVWGLDENWNIVEQTVTLSGQTTVNLSTPLMIPYRMLNDNGTELVGNVYLSTNEANLVSGVPDDTEDIRAAIKVEHGRSNGQTMMMFYPVPAGWTAFLLNWQASISKKTSTVADVHGKAKPYERVWLTKEAFALSTTGTSTTHHQFGLPRAFPEKTIMKMSVMDTTANDAGISGSMTILLLKNSVWGI